MARETPYIFYVYESPRSIGKVKRPKYSSDFFTFNIEIIRRNIPLTYYTNPRRITTSTIFETSLIINCNQFFEHNHNSLWSYLSQLSPYYLTPENIAQLTQSVIANVKELFGISGCFVGVTRPTSNYEPVNIPMVLVIFIDMYQTEQEMIEESMQYVKTTPASKEAILSMKAYSLPRNCCICMERFRDDLAEGGEDSDEVKVSTMACGHMFHYNCIVKWLQTSHMCPLCRYAMPTAT